MKNIFKYNFLFAAAALGVLSSCNEDDDATHVQGYKPTISIDETLFSVTEGEEITVNLTASQALNKSMEFKVELVGGTASFRDYITSGTETVEDEGYGVIGHRFAIPAYTTDYSFTIEPIIDLLPEGAETIELRVFSAGNSNGLIDQTITINVADYVSDNVGIVLDWTDTNPDRYGTLVEGSFTQADGGVGHPSDFDFDLYITDTDENVLAGSFTGGAPEEFVFPASAPDGEYLIWADFYAGPATAGDWPAEDFQFNITMEIAKFGVWNQKIPMTYFASSPASGYDNPNGFTVGKQLAAKLTKTGNTYVLTDADDVVIAQGRMSAGGSKGRAVNKLSRN